MKLRCLLPLMFLPFAAAAQFYVAGGMVLASPPDGDYNMAISPMIGYEFGPASARIGAFRIDESTDGKPLWRNYAPVFLSGRIPLIKGADLKFSVEPGLFTFIGRAFEVGGAIRVSARFNKIAFSTEFSHGFTNDRRMHFLTVARYFR